MRAIAIIDNHLIEVDRPVPIAGTGEILVRVAAAGVNRADVFQRKGNYPAPPGVPADIPGLEISGSVAAVGKDVSRWHAGDTVCALLAGGGYAEYVTVPEGQCLPIPANIPPIDAAALPEAVFTVWHNVFQRGHLQKGENFLVHGGTSGIGITAIQLVRYFGAQVYVTVGSGSKKAFCEALGTTQCLNYKEEDFEKILDPIGMDVILDMIGGDYFAKNIRLLKPEGRLVHINTMHGNKVELNLGQVMSKRLTITGSTIRSRSIAFKTQLARAVEENVWPIISSGRYKTVIEQKFPLAEANQAHALMESGQHIGKILLVNEQ